MKKQKHPLQRLWPYVANHKKLFFLPLLLVGVSTSCALTSPWLLGQIVDRILVPKKMEYILLAASIYLALDIVRATSNYFQNFFFTLLGQNVLQKLRHDLLTRYQQYPMKEFIATPTGKLVTRLINDTSSLQDIFSGGLAIAFGEVILVLATLIWLVVLNFKLGLACVSIFPVMIWTSKKFGHRIRVAFRKSRSSLAKLNGYLAENIYGVSIIQSFNKQAVFKERFIKKSGHYTRMQLSAVKNFAYFHPCITVMSSLSMAILIWYGGFRTTNSVISLGLLVSFMTYLQSLYTPIRDIVEKYNAYISAMTSTERVFDFLDRPIEGNTALKSQFKKNELGCRVEFDQVYFKYAEKKKWNLENVSLQIEPGQKVGVIGHTGAGKSTLVSLLMRFYDPVEGSIRIDGKNILDSDKQELRSRIGYIQQEPFLFSEKVIDNILLWNNSKKEKLMEILELGIEINLEKKVSEKGLNISTGEKQLISFLRAILHDPSLFILDEATSHIDSVTESAILKLSERYFSNRTVIVIAHRLSTLRKMDRIIYLDQGGIKYQGTPDEILKSEILTQSATSAV